MISDRAILRRHFALVLSVALLALVAVVSTPALLACPFCSAVSLTFSEEMGASDVVVIAKVVERPKQDDQSATATTDASMSGFEIVHVLKGEDTLGEEKKFKAFYFGEDPAETHFLLMGTAQPDLAWSTPIALNERTEDYMLKLPDLPENGADRLAFFQEYFEDDEDLLARDAYDEFAKAPYIELKQLKERMPHDQLLSWISDPNVTTTHRRLYLTMLGVCGTEDDVPFLEELVTSEDREARSALDALIACYLTLKGPEGMPLIEENFLKNPDAEYTDTYSAIMAIRFHGQEGDTIPQERLVAALRHMLDRPELADLVIPDLARWEDWSVMDRLVELFKNADETSSWVRVPVINFLRACPDPQAEAYIAELAEIDPDAVKRASHFFPVAGVEPADDSDSGESEVDPEMAEEDTGQPSLSEKLAAEEEAAATESEESTETVEEVAEVNSGGGEMQAFDETVEVAAEQEEQAPEEASQVDEETEVAVTVTPGSDNTPTSGGTGPSASTRVLVVGVPILLGGILFATFWGLLRANRREAAT